MPKATPSSKSPTALVVFNDGALTVQKQQLRKFQARTIDAVELVARTEADNVKRRVLTGMALTVIKENLPHGEFMPWLKKHVTGAGYTQCTYMMRAALKFLDCAQLNKTDVLALTNNRLTLTLGKKSNALRLVSAAAEFAGDLTWGELLEKHGIKDAGKLGGARTTTGKPAATPSEEQLYLQYRDEIGGILLRAEELFIKENRLQHLAGHPEEIAGTVSALRSLADKVEAAAKPLIRPKA